MLQSREQHIIFMCVILISGEGSLQKKADLLKKSKVLQWVLGIVFCKPSAPVG